MKLLPFKIYPSHFHPLLPKLITGELRIEDAEKMEEEVRS